MAEEIYDSIIEKGEKVKSEDQKVQDEETRKRAIYNKAMLMKGGGVSTG